MSFVDAVRTCFSKYADFSGRARRSEYWWFALFYGLVTLVLVLLVYVTGSSLPMLLILGLVVPTIAVSVRRLHDTSKSGWWYLLSFVPFGSIVLLVFFCLDSHPDNQYGPNPKGAGAAPQAPPAPPQPAV